MDDLVSVAWLAANIKAADLVVLDASWHLDPKRDARAEFDARHIPGARFFDLKALSDELHKRGMYVAPAFLWWENRLTL